MTIHVFGSLNLDYVYTVPHLPLAGETLPALNRAVFCGGKGLNQSIALARAGALTAHVGLVGMDGEALTGMLKASGVDVSRVGALADTPTGHAIIQVDAGSGQNCITICSGANGEITPAYIDAALEKAASGDWVLFQNEISSAAYALEQCSKKGLTVALNPSPCTGVMLDPSIYRFVDWLILNEVEGEQLTESREPQEICEILKARYPQCRIVLTLGKNGAMYYDGEHLVTQKAYVVKAVDTTGAGDTFTGFFLAAILAGKAEEEALALANKAAAISVTRAGAAVSIPTLQEVTGTSLP